MTALRCGSQSFEHHFKSLWKTKRWLLETNSNIDWNWNFINEIQDFKKKSTTKGSHILSKNLSLSFSPWYALIYQYQGWIPILWNSNTYAWCCQGWKVDKYVELPGFKARLLRLDRFNPREAFGQFRGSQQSLPSPKIFFGQFTRRPFFCL